MKQGCARLGKDYGKAIHGGELDKGRSLDCGRLEILPVTAGRRLAELANDHHPLKIHRLFSRISTNVYGMESNYMSWLLKIKSCKIFQTNMILMVGFHELAESEVCTLQM